MAMLPKIKKGKKDDSQISGEVENTISKTEDSFDILPKIAPAPQKIAPANLLNVDKVAAVRFHRVKNGYSYEQVEAFIEQIKITLNYLESVSYDQKTEIYTSKQEINDLRERLQTLQATIEVFRANGDPIVKQDGSYLTHSEIAPADNNEMMLQIRELESQLEGALTERDNAIEEAARAWGEESALRKYLEEDLLPWIKSQEDLKIDTKEDNIENVLEVPDTLETHEPAIEVADHAEVEIENDDIVETIKPIVDNDGWDIYELDSKDPIELVEHTNKVKTPIKRKDILFSSPEVAMLEEAGENIEIVEDLSPEVEQHPLTKGKSSSSISPLLATSPEVMINESNED